MFERIRKDFSRHGRSLKKPEMWAMGVYRFGVWTLSLEAQPARWVADKVYGALQLGVQLSCNITIDRETRIGEDLHLIHSGNIRIHPKAVIGDRVGIMHDVTIGTNMERDGAPVIGNDVFIGAGAKILGPVTIGDGARVAANSVVLTDVPAGATAIGVPARIMRYTGRAEGDHSEPKGPRLVG